MKEGILASYQSYTRRRLRLLGGAGLFCLIAFAANLLVGSSDTSIREILAALFRPDTVNPRIRVILWTMRLPAGVMGLLVGAALGTAGAAMQTILNNPLASPYTLGISAGAGFGASLALLGGLGSLQLLGNFLVPVSAFAFAILTCLGIYAVSKRQNFSSAAMVLAGIGMVFSFRLSNLFCNIWLPRRRCKALFSGPSAA